MLEESVSPLDMVRRTYIDYFVEMARYECAKDIARACREACRDLPLGDKVRCFRKCFGDKEALLVADFRRAIELFLYPNVIEYPLVYERELLYDEWVTETYDPVYGSLN